MDFVYLFQRAFISRDGRIAVAREMSGKRWFRVWFIDGQIQIEEFDPRPTGITTGGKAKIKNGQFFVGFAPVDTIKIVGRPIFLSTITDTMKKFGLYERILQMYLNILLNWGDSQDIFFKMAISPEIFPEIEQVIILKVNEAKKRGIVDEKNVRKYYNLAMEKDLHAHRRLLECAIPLRVRG